MADINKILAVLDQVKEIPAKGHQGRWQACCPAHHDKSPSLHITLTHEDMVLFKCWAGCGGNEVMNAISDDTSIFFPPAEIRSDLKSYGFSVYYSQAQLDELTTQIFFCAIGKSTMDAGGKVEGEQLSKMRLCYQSLRKEYPRLKAGRYKNICHQIETVFSWFGEVA